MNSIAQQQSAISAEIQRYEEIIGPELETRVCFIVKCRSVENPMRTEDQVPLEFSIAAFSIVEGVLGCLSRVIDPGTLPTGFLYNARQLCDETGLPLPKGSPEDHQHKIEIIVEEIDEFVKKHMGKIPPSSSHPTHPTFHVFAMPKDIVSVRASLDWLLDKTLASGSSASKFLVTFKVHDLSKLLFVLGRLIRKKAKSYNPNWIRFNLVRLAEAHLNSNKFNYLTGITCPYHLRRAEDAIDLCTKNIALRLAFLFLEDIVDLSELQISKTKNHSIAEYTVVHSEEFLPPGSRFHNPAH